MRLIGKIIAETKVKDNKGMAVRATLDNGVYIEIANIDSEQTFKELCDLISLEKHLAVILDKPNRIKVD